MTFVKGKSGNPNGAPKRSWTWAGVLQDAVEKSEEDGRTVKEIIAESLLTEAKKGNILAQKELMNRMDGQPTQSVEHSGEINTSLVVYKPEKNQQE